MFNGSEHFNDDYFQALLAIGATDLNGTTNHDRTNYFQNVPTAGLDQVLWLESDRMGHLLGALDQAKLDEQRGVVQNEKRQRENVPYGKEEEILTTELFPAGHPYSWTVIGSMEDLDNTTVEDCHEWFRRYYGAANAVVVIAGDVDANDVLVRVEKYFGEIDSGPPIVRPEVNVPVHSGNTRSSYHDQVPEARVVLAWNTPQKGTREDALLSLAAGVLAHGKSSRLFKPLVYERQIASTVSAAQWSREICGNFTIAGHAKPGESIAEVEQEIVAILDDLLEKGPTEDELARIRAHFFSGFMKGMERVGGFGGKSDILASSLVFGGTPDAYKEYNRYIAEATAEDVRSACVKWLGDGKFTLTCHPMPEFTVSESKPDRTKLPELTQVRAGKFPDLQRTTLENGLEIVLARRSGVPAVVMEAVIHAGFADDHDHPGMASLAMTMLDEGTAGLDALQISEQLQLLGASLSSSAGLDFSAVRMKTLRPGLRQSAALFNEVLRHPVFPEYEMERLRKQQIVSIQREMVTPISMAMRVVPKILFGDAHRYSHPLTGSGHMDSVAALTRQDVTHFYRKWVEPANMRLVLAGDVSLDEAEELFGQHLGKWQQERAPSHGEGQPVSAAEGRVYFMHRPGSLQSIVIGAYLFPPFDPETEIAEEIMNDIIGGQFTSRINLNLREDKHWTYGARSMIIHTHAERPLFVVSSVQMDKTRAAMEEIRKELEQVISNNPISKQEFEKTRKNAILALPGQWETTGAVAGSVSAMIKLGLPPDYYQTYAGRLEDLTLEEVRGLTQILVDPGRLNWCVVGDRSQVLPSLEGSGLGAITEIDTDGGILS
jgi:predicted Zn-dependent peptidase